MGKLLAFDLIGGLASLIGDAFNWLIEGLKNLLFALVKLVLVLVIGVIKGVLCTIGYMISRFILSLLDFIEIIFRLLAGLEVEGGMRLVIGGNNGTGSESSDLLIQLIRNDAIQQAFLAMCIVGVFLLVLTTIFQMIKVEYTTEGAKNAKGPILEKAFKGLANLMLIPILCIFGVFLGNEILGLLDTATKGTGDSPSIGGALFVAACGDARYREGQARCLVSAEVITAGAIAGGAVGSTTGGPYGTAAGAAAGAGISIIWPVLYCIGDTFVEYYSLERDSGDMVFDESETNPYADSTAGKITYDQIDANFINGVEGYRYNNMTNVTTYYNMFQINYILLLVGGCICIKCLYNVCFGMILRLYYCAALFVLSPVVIGMSPVTDNMGKWRTAFIGKAISAYGVVISMNLFFTIIKVLLSIDLEFTRWGADVFSFGYDLALGIIKGVIVMGGCLMIEKWSKEFGAYFGAEDALSSGAAFAKETGELAKNAVKTTAVAAAAVAAGVMTAGAGSGAVAGIAGKIGALGSKVGGGLSKAGTALAGKGGALGKLGGTALKSVGKGIENIGEGANAYRQKRVRDVGAENKYSSALKEQQGIRDAKVEGADLALKNLNAKKAEIEAKMANVKGKDKEARLEALRKGDSSHIGLDAINEQIAQHEKAKQDANTAFTDWEKDKETVKMRKAHDDSLNAEDFNAAERMVMGGAARKAISGLAKRNSLLGGLMSGFADGKKEWEGYEKEGAVGPEGEAALGVITGARKDAKEKAYENRYSSEIDIRNTRQAQIMNEAVLNALNAQRVDDQKNADKQYEAIKEMSRLIEGLKDKEPNATVQDQNSRYFGRSKEWLQNKQADLTESLSDLGAKQVNGKFKLDGSGHVEIELKGADTIKDVMTKALADKWNPKKITDELTRVFEEQGAAGNKKLLEEILKAIEKVKGSTGGGK